jgi:hypothetical protein
MNGGNVVLTDSEGGCGGVISKGKRQDETPEEDKGEMDYQFWMDEDSTIEYNVSDFPEKTPKKNLAALLRWFFPKKYFY